MGMKMFFNVLNFFYVTEVFSDSTIKGQLINISFLMKLNKGWFKQEKQFCFLGDKIPYIQMNSSSSSSPRKKQLDVAHKKEVNQALELTSASPI